MQFEKAKQFILEKLQKELAPQLCYHGISHVMDVFHACVLLGKKEGINEEEQVLLLTAALFHDSGFIIRAIGHELVSADYARQYLPGFGYSEEQVERICGMIMATRIPQSPQNKLEQILCDADLDYLGRDDFYSLGDQLFRECITLGFLKTEEEWDIAQVKFLESHNYFTPTAIRLRKPKKDDHLRQIRTKIKTCT